MKLKHMLITAGFVIGGMTFTNAQSSGTTDSLPNNDKNNTTKYAEDLSNKAYEAGKTEDSTSADVFYEAQAFMKMARDPNSPPPSPQTIIPVVAELKEAYKTDPDVLNELMTQTSDKNAMPESSVIQNATGELTKKDQRQDNQLKRQTDRSVKKGLKNL